MNKSKLIQMELALIEARQKNETLSDLEQIMLKDIKSQTEIRLRQAQRAEKDAANSIAVYMPATIRIGDLSDFAKCIGMRLRNNADGTFSLVEPKT